MIEIHRAQVESASKPLGSPFEAQRHGLDNPADRIQARAVRRCGELLKQVPAAGGARTDLGRAPTRSDAADEAGLSEHQRKQSQPTTTRDTSRHFATTRGRARNSSPNRCLTVCSINCLTNWFGVPSEWTAVTGCHGPSRPITNERPYERRTFTRHHSARTRALHVAGTYRAVRRYPPHGCIGLERLRHRCRHPAVS